MESGMSSPASGAAAATTPQCSQQREAWDDASPNTREAEESESDCERRPRFDTAPLPPEDAGLSEGAPPVDSSSPFQHKSGHALDDYPCCGPPAVPPPPPPLGALGDFDEEEEPEDDLPPAAAHQLALLLADCVASLTISARDGWTPELCARHLPTVIPNASQLRTVALVDLLVYDAVLPVARAVLSSPGVTSVILAGTSPDSEDQLSLRSVRAIADLLIGHPGLRELAVTNCLHDVAGDGVAVLAAGVARAPALRALVLECNGIGDDGVLSIAQALVGQRTINLLDLSHNTLTHQGLDVLCELMSFNSSLCDLKLAGNAVHCLNDTWEGFRIQEECAVNRQLLQLGDYCSSQHHHWPLGWRRLTGRLWRAWYRARRPVDAALWEAVLQWLDPRPCATEQVRLWMKLEPAPYRAPEVHHNLRHV